MPRPPPTPRLRPSTPTWPGTDRRRTQPAPGGAVAPRAPPRSCDSHPAGHALGSKARTNPRTPPHSCDNHPAGPASYHPPAAIDRQAHTLARDHDARALRPSARRGACRRYAARNASHGPPRLCTNRWTIGGQFEEFWGIERNPADKPGDWEKPLDPPCRTLQDILSQLDNGGGTLRKLGRTHGKTEPVRRTATRVGSSTDPRPTATGAQQTRMTFTRSAEARMTNSLTGRRWPTTSPASATEVTGKPVASRGEGNLTQSLQFT